MGIKALEFQEGELELCICGRGEPWKAVGIEKRESCSCYEGRGLRRGGRETRQGTAAFVQEKGQWLGWGHKRGEREPIERRKMWKVGAHGEWW